jgi:nifR3 family TIM-barrel protein
MIFDETTQPVIGLSPMDGVSDAPFRYMVATHGSPDLILSEFVHVMGLCMGGERLWQDFIFSENERPISGQIFGAEPEYFYHAAKIVCELGFDGVDINMGCPAKTVTEGGAGAALIRTPELAQEIVRQVKRGVQDWYETGEVTGVKDEMKKRIERMVEQRQARANAEGLEFKKYANGSERSLVPVSVKTRLGYDQIVIKDWVKYLAEVEPAWITIHGRILKQLYSGQANWEAIAEAVQTVPHIPIIANGDVKTYVDIKRVLEVTKARGALIGRGTYGNPWFFKHLTELKHALETGSELPAEYIPSLEERFQAMIQHCKLHVELKGEGAFMQMRKHLGWYANGFEGAVELRKKLVTTNNVAEVEQIISEFPINSAA